MRQFNIFYNTKSNVKRIDNWQQKRKHKTLYQLNNHLKFEHQFHSINTIKRQFIIIILISNTLQSEF